MYYRISKENEVNIVNIYTFFNIYIYICMMYEFIMREKKYVERVKNAIEN